MLCILSIHRDIRFFVYYKYTDYFNSQSMSGKKSATIYVINSNLALQPILGKVARWISREKPRSFRHRTLRLSPSRTQCGGLVKHSAFL